jgi:hypothetical protein
VFLLWAIMRQRKEMTINCSRLPKGTILEGKINDLCNYLTNGWRRRDITVWQDCTGSYPKVSDEIIIIDSDGDRYRSIFTEPEENGHVCLGKPSRLERWHRKYYPLNTVFQDKIYFEYTGTDIEFLIFTSAEWGTKKAKSCFSQPL